MPNESWSNVVYVNFGIYNIEQRQINVVYFSDYLKNVRQRRNSVYIFIIDFRYIGQCRKQRCEYDHLQKKQQISKPEQSDTFEIQIKIV